jgi:hypothetical protein
LRLAGTLEAVQGLQSLTWLELRSMVQDAQEDRQQQYFSQLTNLQVLSLHLQCHLPGGLTHLQALTALSLSSCNSRVSILPDDSSSIGRLTNLRTLRLVACECNPQALSDITSLENLCLRGVRWAAAAGFYQWLAQLQHLTQVQVSFPPDLAATDAPLATHGALYAALTASTHLQQLALSSVPSIALLHMFPAGRQLLQLQPSPPTIVDAVTVQAMVQCCPNLQVLVAADVPVDPALANLQHLTRLDCQQACSADQAAALGSLTGLQQLQLTDGSTGTGSSRHWRKQDLKPLLRLTRLASLSISGSTRSTDELPAANMLSELVGLQRLELHSVSLTERQLYSLTSLTALTHLKVNSSHLGVLLVDRVLPMEATGNRLAQAFARQQFRQGRPLVLVSKVMACGVLYAVQSWNALGCTALQAAGPGGMQVLHQTLACITSSSQCDIRICKVCVFCSLLYSARPVHDNGATAPRLNTKCLFVFCFCCTKLHAAPGASSDIPQQLQRYFSCNHKQTQQELARLRDLEKKATPLQQRFAACESAVAAD